MKIALAFVAPLCLVVVAGLSTRQDVQSIGSLPAEHADQAQDNTVPFMRAKLAGSEQVLDGIVSENFELIQIGARRMKRISENVKWPKSTDSVYQHLGREFRDQCDRVVERAVAGDLQGVHYAYLHLTTNCFNCHNHVRSKFKIERNDDPQGPIQLIPGHWEGKTFRPDRTAKGGRNTD